MAKLARYACITIWLLIGLYAGVSGWMALRILQSVEMPHGSADGDSDFEGINFSNVEEVLKFEEERKANAFAGWIFKVPEHLIPLIACFGFGILGGAGRLLKELKSTGRLLAMRLIYAEPLLGGLIGLVAVLIAWTVPSLLVTDKGPIRAESLVVFAFCGGAFSDRAWIWLEDLATKWFGKR